MYSLPMPSSFGGKSASDLAFSLDVLTVITLVAGGAGGERVGARGVKSEVALFLLSVGSLLPSKGRSPGVSEWSFFLFRNT